MRKRERRHKQRSHQGNRSQLDESPGLGVFVGPPSTPDEKAGQCENGELNRGRHGIGDRKSLGHTREGDADILDLIVLTVKQKPQRPVEKCRVAGAASRTTPESRTGTATAIASALQRRYNMSTRSSGARRGLRARVSPSQTPPMVQRPLAAARRNSASPRRRGPFTLPAWSVKRTGHARLIPNKAIAPASPRHRSPNSFRRIAVAARIVARSTKKKRRPAQGRLKAPRGKSMRRALGG